MWVNMDLKRRQPIGVELVKKGIVKEEDIEMLSEKAMEDPCKPGNPREVSKEDFIELYEEAM